VLNDNYTTEQESVQSTDISEDVNSEGDTEGNPPGNMDGEPRLDVQQRDTAGQYKVTISNVESKGAFAKIQFAVWSDENGQDDIRWYVATRDRDDAFSSTFSVSEYHDLGKYIVHAYGSSDTGTMFFLSGKELNIPRPEIADLSIISEDQKKGNFCVSAQVVDEREYIRKMQFAVWSENGGQDDLIWYDVAEDEAHCYSKTINIQTHRYTLGKYYVHAYVTDITGKMYYAGSVAWETNTQKGTLSISEDKVNGVYKIELRNSVVPGGIREVYFPTWSQVNGQDDIQWYRASKVEDSLYYAELSIKNHKGLGSYNVHAYAVTMNGSMVGIGTDTFEIEQPTIGDISMDNYDEVKGTFRVVLSGVKEEAKIKEILVPIWSVDGGQDDIIWYSAKKNGKGDYVVNVNIKNHKYTMGKYSIHTYITDITGCQFFSGMQQHEIVIRPGEWKITQHDDDKRQYTVELQGINVPGGISQVMFPTWSEING